MKNQTLEGSRVRSVRGAKTELRVVRSAGRLSRPEGPEVREERAEIPSRSIVDRHELAALLKVSVRTVDEMVASREITALRPGGVLVRFYVPDVVRELTAAAVARLQKLKEEA